jgi:hypothetical protein
MEFLEEITSRLSGTAGAFLALASIFHAAEASA